MSRNIVFEGWLTKSPPTKRIWRTKWRRRWFALRQSGELPGQYFLDYYADRNCRRLKGTINLDLCEQVDAGLHMERTGNGTLDPKLRGSVFTIQTQSRTYHLEADCEAEMEKWVDAICRVCGLRATDDSSNVLGPYQNNLSALSAMNDQYECTGPYIPISECITGVRAQDSRRAFTFDPKNIVTSARSQFEKASDTRSQQMYMSQPHIRLNNADFSENESNLSDEEWKSLNASQSNIRPPVPPRPPKTFTMSKDFLQKEIFQGPKIEEPMEIQENVGSLSLRRWPRRMSHGGAPSLSNRSHLSPNILRSTDDEDELCAGNLSMQYCNLSSLPPAVDRALKPRHSSHSIGHIHNLSGQLVLQSGQSDEVKADVLQYLDLDLHMSKPITSKSHDVPMKKMDISQFKLPSAIDADSAYKTVDFLKTEAFNITRKDAEASRSSHN
ncbi:GRB2-associated-binding protein 1 isoform X2 [Achroia grisella]|uniref:GRB2-associated-binding protein 1 isoform X2 n=1 Tax=Achroia grisella TaxID=688607 RepID=UPI0027D2A212|nr:GRB2-associated-binding protein 1 isoform X2 [Achroia grisella]